MLDVTDCDKIELRFALGARVMCQCAGWKVGTVVQRFYSEPEMEIGKCVPYQVHLDPTVDEYARLISVPFDEDRAIRSAICGVHGYDPEYEGRAPFATTSMSSAKGHAEDVPKWRSFMMEHGFKGQLLYGTELKSMNEGATLLLQLCLWGEDLDIFQYLLDLIFDRPFLGRYFYREALVYAESNLLLTPLAAACMHGHADIAKYLLANGATVRVRDEVVSGGFTPLHSACFLGRADCVRVLVEHSASILIETSTGCTPLTTAACEGRTTCVEVMLGEHHMRSDDGQLVRGGKSKTLGRSREHGRTTIMQFSHDGMESMLMYVNTALRSHMAYLYSHHISLQALELKRGRLYLIADCLRMLLDANAGQRHLEASAESRRLLKLVARQRLGSTPADAMPPGEEDAEARKAAAEAAEEAARALLAEEEAVVASSSKNKNKKNKKKKGKKDGAEADDEPSSARVPDLDLGHVDISAVIGDTAPPAALPSVTSAPPPPTATLAAASSVAVVDPAAPPSAPLPIMAVAAPVEPIAAPVPPVPVPESPTSDGGNTLLENAFLSAESNNNPPLAVRVLAPATARGDDTTGRISGRISGRGGGRGGKGRGTGKVISDVTPTSTSGASSSGETPKSEPAPPVPSDENEDECVICSNAKRTHIFAPCGHQCVCKDCSERVLSQNGGNGECPMCRAPCFMAMQVFK